MADLDFLTEFRARMQARQDALIAEHEAAIAYLAQAPARSVEDVKAAIRADLELIGGASWTPPVIARAAHIVVTYPTAWHQYSADPEDWDETYAVALLYRWRKLNDGRVAAQAEAA